MKQPNIILIMTDQHRADHVGWASESKWLLPNLNRIATNGTTFQKCVSVNPICMPARTALLTGRYTHQINTLSMSGDLNPKIPTFAQALQRSGYSTAAIGKLHWFQTWKWGAPPGNGIDLVSLNELTRQYGFDYVWEAAGKQLATRNYCDWGQYLERNGILKDYREHVALRGPNTDIANNVKFTGKPWPFDERHYVDIVTGDRVCEVFQSREKDKPLFMLASFCSPHPPFDPPQRFLDMVDQETWEPVVAGCDGDLDLDKSTLDRLNLLWRAYRAMLLCVDEQIGRIFDVLETEKIADNTVILFTSDHGEMLGDHGYFQKQRYHWQSVQVPLAVYDPRSPARFSCNTPVELTDITATILDLAGQDPVASLGRDWPAFTDVIPGRSLLPIITGEKESVRDFAYSETSGEWHMIQDNRFKYIRRSRKVSDQDLPKEVLFDMENDRNECRNVAYEPDYKEILDLQRTRLLDLLTTTPSVQTRFLSLLGPDGSDEFPLL